MLCPAFSRLDKARESGLRSRSFENLVALPTLLRAAICPQMLPNLIMASMFHQFLSTDLLQYAPSCIRQMMVIVFGNEPYPVHEAHSLL
jgi:hypothetical protein